MNPKIKDILGAVGALAALLLGIAGMSYANTYSKSVEPSSFRSFAVSGEGKVVAVPDIARFDFTVLTDGGTDVADLQRKNTERMNKVIAFVKKNGVDEKDVKTEYYSLDPRYQHYDCNPPVVYQGGSARPCPPPEIAGYTVRQNVSVKIRDFSKIGDIMGGVVENGANQVGSLNFTIDDPAKLRDEARSAAIAKAKESAVSLAKAGGFGIGRLLTIDEGGDYAVYDKYGGRGGGIEALGAPAAAPAPSIEPGSQDITVSVTLRYEIE